ncbi:MAG: DUF2516 family protein [Galactobacter sp.]|uniref:DUF2516 family protein n=1 Tax=Galactobacter sp. TaxID=2676125 RepID=UPI0025BE18FB|nr:DUF2516 family protein [Galactobacter sp.]
MIVAFYVTRWLFLVVGVVVAILCLWALLDCLRRPAERFTAYGKLSKGAWSGILVAATAITVFGAFMASTSSLFTLAAAVAAGVYLADVRPEVSGKGSSWY